MSVRAKIPFLTALLALSCGLQSGGKVAPPPADPVYAWQEGIDQEDWNLLVITLDTTRRDAVGFSGAGPNVTPTLDSLATVGTVFDDMVSPVPITLPAHTTLFTGMDPPEHGIRHNGIFTVGDTLVTLAELCQERGYTTAAFVSGFPLIARFGIAQGFGHYDDVLSDRVFSAAEESAERIAGETVGAARRWATSEDFTQPYFVWVHLYDPHFPYLPPEPFRSRFPEDPYRGEIAYTDHEVGRLLATLRSSGALDRTFVLVVGDHGESLGQHQESTHSFFAYDATQRIPCVLVPPSRWEGTEMRGKVVRTSARMRDLAPTLANLLGWPGEHWQSLHSHSYVPVFRGTSIGDPVAYVESLAPALDYGWHDLRGVRTPDWKYIRAPRPELYDLARDPGETLNVIADHPDRAKELEVWLDWFLSRENKNVDTQALDAATLENLRSLGYLGGAGGNEHSTEDPKDKIRYHAAINLARQLGSEYRFAEAIQQLDRVVRREPQITTARRMVALFSMMSGDLATARPVIEGLIAEHPDNSMYLGDHADLLLAEGKPEEALALLEELAARDSTATKLDWRRGNALEILGRTDAAIAAYQRAAARDPRNAKPHWSIARLHSARGDTAAARADLLRGLAADPTHAGSLSALGDLAFAQGRNDAGNAYVSRALAADPFEPRANYLRGWNLQQAGDVAGAVTCYQRAVQALPTFTLARQNLGTLYLGMRQPALAQKEFEAALASGPASALLHLNLGVAFAQQNQIAAAATQWELGLGFPADDATRGQLTQNLRQAKSMLGS